MTAAGLYKKFHGKPPANMRDTKLPVADYDSHPELAQLGKLVSITIGEQNIDEPWAKKITWSPAEAPDLAAEPGGKQLYIVGGKQDLSDLLRNLPVDIEKVKLDLGFCYQVEYLTAKKFDRFKPIVYYHDLGEETGVPPRITYNRKNKRIHFVGGEYVVRPEGITN